MKFKFVEKILQTIFKVNIKLQSSKLSIEVASHLMKGLILTTSNVRNEDVKKRHF